MTQSITPQKMRTRIITLDDAFLRRIENRAIAHGKTLSEEITWSLIVFWEQIGDVDNRYDESKLAQQQIRTKIFKKMYQLRNRLNPTASDLHNYLKSIDLATIRATLDYFVEKDCLVSIHTSHATRYAIKK